MSWLLCAKSSANVSLPLGPSKTYCFSTFSHGSARRSRLSSSLSRVNSFSFARNAVRAESHSSRETTGWFWIRLLSFAMCLTLLSGRNRQCGTCLLVSPQTWRRSQSTAPAALRIPRCCEIAGRVTVKWEATSPTVNSQSRLVQQTDPARRPEDEAGFAHHTVAFQRAPVAAIIAVVAVVAHNPVLVVSKMD